MSQEKSTSFFKQPAETSQISKSNKKKRSSSNLEEPELPARRIITLSALEYQISAAAHHNCAVSANIGPYWFQELKKEFSQPYFKELGEILDRERTHYIVYPPDDKVYYWSSFVDIYEVKVVILGQDPYIRPHQAHGLAFSVPKGVEIPRSLVNIYAELVKDIPGFYPPRHGNLSGWAMQGVLLLNTCLTVRAGVPDSHKGIEWETFTDDVINWINRNLSHVVFLLWGNNAKAKANSLSKTKHLILTAAHPAHRGFLGCRHFSKTNEYLIKNKKHIIDWKYLP